MVTSNLTYTRPNDSPIPALWTYKDLIDRLIVFANAGTQSGQLQDYRLAIDEAYRWIAFKRAWRHLYKPCEIAMVAPYDTGTVAYTHSTRTVTLTGGTWPTWALYGHIRIDNVFYQVESVTSSTALVLTLSSNPGANVASGTSYTIYRSIYTLPSDFGGKIFQPENNRRLWGCRYIEPQQWYALERQVGSASAPQGWTVLRDPHLINSYAVYLYPYPSTADTLGFLYLATPRPLRISGHAAADSVGTVSISSTTVTGTLTTFTAFDVGTVLRVSASTSVLPDGVTGVNPYTEQAMITAVGGATSCTIDRALTGTYTGVKYVKSDPVDMPDVLLQAVLAHARWQYTVNRPGEPKLAQGYERLAREALVAAMENDQMVKSGFEGSWYVDRMQQDI